MHPFNSNEMFILALVAISIVGVVCIGLLVVVLIMVYRRKVKIMVDCPLQDVKEIDTNKAETTTEIPSITIGDWVSFLSTEKFGLSSTYFNLLAIIVGLFGVLSAISLTSEKPILGIPFGVVLCLGLFFWVLNHNNIKRIQQRSNLSKNILDEIMNRTLINEKAIRQKWIQGIKSIEDKWSKKSS
jgi:hypothetical protein